MAKPATWLDTLSLLFTVAVMGIVAWATLQSNLFQTQASTWYFIRSSGLIAYILFTASTLWGLLLSSKLIKDWSPGTLSMLLHSTISWLGIGFSLTHAVLLLFDNYFTYGLTDIAVPFTGPYRPLAVGFGTLAFWLLLLVSLSFAFKKWLGHARWKLLHYTSFGGFMLISAHALFAGTDATKIGFQMVIGTAVMLVVILLGYRLGSTTPKTSPRAIPK